MSGHLYLGNKLASGLDLGGEALSVFGQGTEVAFHLQAMPELWRLIEEGAEADGHGRRDGALAEYDFVDGTRRYADGAGHGVLGDTHGDQVFLEEDLSGGDAWVQGFAGAHQVWALYVSHGDKLVIRRFPMGHASPRAGCRA